jgi:hypothetical protein
VAVVMNENPKKKMFRATVVDGCGVLSDWRKKLTVKSLEMLL